MGLAASQARALLLVARKSDLEYRSQCISQRKMVLAQQTEQIAKDYSTKMSNRKLRFTYNLDGNKSESITEDFQYSSLGAENAKFVGEYRLLNNRGDIVVASINEIPQKDVQIPVYTLVDSNNKKVTTPEEIYSKAASSSLGSKVTLYAMGDDGEYVKVQNNDGSAVEDAAIKVKSADGYVSQNVYSGKDEDGKAKLADGITLYTKGVLDRTTTTTDPQSATVSDGQQYVQTGYQTVKQPREQAADGYYYSDDGRRYIVCPDVNSTAYFQNGLRTGAFIIQKANTAEVKDDNGLVMGTHTTWEDLAWQGSDIVQDVLDTTDDAMAESEYESKLAVIKCQDQKLDMELKQIETQHKAVETEMDSVKKVIDKNIEQTFKLFA